MFRHIIELYEQKRKKNGGKRNKGKIQLEEILEDVKTQTMGAMVFKLQANGTYKVSYNELLINLSHNFSQKLTLQSLDKRGFYSTS